MASSTPLPPLGDPEAWSVAHDGPASHTSGASATAALGEPQDDEPRLSIKASPRVSFAPARVTAEARLSGGRDDYEEYYCASVEWDWGDGSISESSVDCEPFEAGKSEIQRSFRSSHTFPNSGEYDVRITLKRNDKVLTSARTTIQVRSGLRD